MARMKIFKSLQEEAFESPPVFNSAERKRFFSLSSMLSDSIANLRTPTNKVCFLVTAGYFKARRKFFNRVFWPADIGYVARQIGVNPGEVCVESYSKETFARHQRLILNYFGCSPFDETAKVFAVGEIAALVRVQVRPKRVLLEIIQVLTRKKIALPSYNVLANLIVAAQGRLWVGNNCTLSRAASTTRRRVMCCYQSVLSAKQSLSCNGTRFCVSWPLSS